ncbi:glutaredoxin family protein [Wenzhouxiangella marina]|uniref:Uncharacterized protein n=1 Tax=Wenzhouxiangella marina TaxID=1579979 RepID=A0A0K0XUQ4_9GAMM|nr:glutaredoxin domain-containing protein [Wenzhouxiangella marina]AKS41413.1 hypothetical protein WM2015_1036 [Wenzhouxiangella marina]MBB6086833.1 glutaredoxin [Wenzhouxiangella marina]
MRTIAFWVIAIFILGLAWKQIDGSRLRAADISPEHEVVMFTAPWCGYCDRARAHLNERGIDFLEIDVEGSASANQQWRDAGGRGVPLTFIGEQRFAGYSREAYDQALDRL